MKYVAEFRSGTVAAALAREIARHCDPTRRYAIMEFCGGHTHAIARYGLEALLPDNVRLVHGPGCPVCVLPMGRINAAIALARRPEVILCSYGDTMRVPGSKRESLITARAGGADVRMIYSPSEVLEIARAHPDREVVFFAIGFETTAPATALTIRKAAEQGLRNLSVYCNHVLTPAAIQHLLQAPVLRNLPPVAIDGFLGPAHVSTVIGSAPYQYFAEEFKRPVVIAGFEPLDVLQAIDMLIQQLNDGRHKVENQFTRAVTVEGNVKAQELVADVLELRRRFEWRGLGEVPYSALRIKAAFAEFDAERRFAMTEEPAPDHPACECGAILRGTRRPADCKLFGKACTPDNPMGSCMVSSEGACAAYYTYGRFRAPATQGAS